MQDQDGAAPEEVLEQASPPATQDENPATEKTEEKPKVDPVQKRIDKLTREKYDYARQLEKALDVIERLKPVEQPKSEPKVESPVRTQFASDDEYARAVIRHEAKTEAERLFNEYKQQSQVEQARSEQQTRLASFEAELKRASEKYDDFDDVVRNPANGFFNGALLEALQDMGTAGAEIAYKLGQNPSEGWRLFNLKPWQLSLALSKLEEGPQMSSAPKPIKPLSGQNASGQSSDPSDKDDVAAWLRKREAQLRARAKSLTR